uniref:Uncharacterized protein n=1 Tax=Anguilla anguilla TaxID=7936 RepID=A0A0E9RK96_ANGAN
MFIAMATQLQT